MTWLRGVLRAHGCVCVRAHGCVAASRNACVGS